MRFAGRKRTIPRWSECAAADRRVVGPYGSITGDAKQRADVPKAWLPPTKFHSKIWGVSHGHRPLRIEGEVSANTQASGAERSVSGAAARDGCVAAKIIPNGAINTGRSRGGRSARQHRAGRGRARPLPRGPNVSADGPPGRRPLRKVCRSPGNGPMYLRHGFRRPNSAPKFGASVIGIGPYGTKRKPAATTRAALSEAESAEREAGQIQSLPDDLRVQHGAEGSEVSARLRPCSR